MVAFSEADNVCTILFVELGLLRYTTQPIPQVTAPFIGGVTLHGEQDFFYGSCHDLHESLLLVIQAIGTQQNIAFWPTA